MHMARQLIRDAITVSGSLTYLLIIMSRFHYLFYLTANRKNLGVSSGSGTAVSRIPPPEKSGS